MRKLMVIETSDSVSTEYALENQSLRSILQDVANELDRLGAPAVQPNGHSYNPVGRLRRLNREVIGELARERIYDLNKDIANLKRRLKKSEENNMASTAKRYEILKQMMDRGEIEVTGRNEYKGDDCERTESIPSDLLDHVLDQNEIFQGDWL